MLNGLALSVHLINLLIDKAQESGEDKYYADFVKLHKLLFIAQCYSYAKDAKPLFDSKITANGDGPYIWSMAASIPAYCGFGLIKKRVLASDVGASYRHLSVRMEHVLKTVVNKYGHLSTRDVVLLTKHTEAWRVHYDDEKDERCNVIEPIWMIATGCQLFAEEL